MSERVAFYNGSFRGLRITQGELAQSGCSLDFLAWLHKIAERRPSALSAMDPDLRRLLSYYRDCFKTPQA